MQEPIALAYLLARIADTITDTEVLLPQQRLEQLLALRAAVQRPGQSVFQLNKDWFTAQASATDRQLLESVTATIDQLAHLTEADRQAVINIVTTLTQGMEFDLNTFTDRSRIVCLKDEGELEQYIYLVAGCVGEFWTLMSLQHTSALRHWDRQRYTKLGIEFGKALQLTNVLRDLPEDLANGRCYLPESDLTRTGIAIESIADTGSLELLEPVFDEWLDHACDYYRSALSYITALPRLSIRLRLAALWPALIGLHTLAHLRTNKAALLKGQRLKIKRKQVYFILIRSLWVVLSNSAIERWIGGLVETSVPQTPGENRHL